MKTKRPKLLQAKSSNFTYNCFCYKIRNFNENVVFVTKNEPSPATWPNENKEQKSTAGQVQQLDLQPLLLQN